MSKFRGITWNNSRFGPKIQIRRSIDLAELGDLGNITDEPNDLPTRGATNRADKGGSTSGTRNYTDFRGIAGQYSNVVDTQDMGLISDNATPHRIWSSTGAITDIVTSAPTSLDNPGSTTTTYDWGSISPLSNLGTEKLYSDTTLAGGRYDSLPTFRFLYDGKYALWSIYNGGGNGSGMTYWNMENGTNYDLTSGVANTVYNGYFGSLINHISPDGSKGYFIRTPGQDGGPSNSSVSAGNLEIWTITFATPGDFSTATSTTGSKTVLTLSASAGSGQITGITWFDNGNKVIISDEYWRFDIFECSDPYDPLTIQSNPTTVTINPITDEWSTTVAGNLASATFSDDGRTMFATNSNKVFTQYDLSTPWDLSTRTVRSSIQVPNNSTILTTSRDVLVLDVDPVNGVLWFAGGYNNDGLYGKYLEVVTS